MTSVGKDKRFSGQHESRIWDFSSQKFGIFLKLNLFLTTKTYQPRKEEKKLQKRSKKV